MKLTRLLDPRLMPEPPVREGVSIPWKDLSARSHELPSKGWPLWVADLDGAEPALQWLSESGRRVVGTDAFEFGESEACRLWSPTPYLEDFLATNPEPRSALDLACGAGRDAVYLADAGWEATAVDILPDALERARDLAVRYAPGARIDWIQADLDDVAFDPGRNFDLITMYRFFDAGLLRRAADWLRPGGVLLVESFAEEHRLETGRPSSPKRAIREDEVRECLEGLDVEMRRLGAMTRIQAIKIGTPNSAG